MADNTSKTHTFQLKSMSDSFEKKKIRALEDRVEDLYRWRKQVEIERNGIYADLEYMKTLLEPNIAEIRKQYEIKAAKPSYRPRRKRFLE